MKPTAITKPLLAVAVDYDKLTFPKLMSPKLDGIRCLKINGKAVSRKFKPIPNDYIRTWIETHCSDGFDGEILCLDPTAPFAEVSSMVMSKEHPAEKTFVYGVFDWVAGDRLLLPFKTRIANVETWFAKLSVEKPEVTRHMRPIPHDLVLNREDLTEQHVAWVSHGYEGTMLRDPEGIYKCGRSTVNQGILLKVKDWMDEEAIVIDVEEMMENTNEATRDEVGATKRSTAKEGMVGKGTMGKLVCKCLTDGAEFRIGGGPGLTAKKRQEMWDQRNDPALSVIDRVVKFKHQADPGATERGNGVAPRFPQWLGIRNMVIDG